MISVIDGHRGVFGVGPICRVMGIARSTYYAFEAVERDPELASDRARQDRRDMAAIKQAFDGSRGRYGARKVWHQLRRSGHGIARCTVERLMKVMGLQGVVLGRKVITTNPDAAQPCPDDKVNRAFVADTLNQLWVSDFTYVSSWQGLIWRGLSNQLAVAAAPALESVADAMASVARATGPLGVAIRVLFDNLGRLTSYAAGIAALMAGRFVAASIVAAASVRGLAMALVILRGALLRLPLIGLVVAAGELIHWFGRLVPGAGGFGKPRASALLIAMLWLTGCATAGSGAYVPCPPIVEYSQAEQERACGEIEILTDRVIVVRMLSELRRPA